MERFDLLYFDTQPLIASGWPRLSQASCNVLYVANKLGIKAIVPEPVRIELRSHWRRRYTEALGRLEALKRMMVEVGVEFDARGRVLDTRTRPHPVGTSTIYEVPFPSVDIAMQSYEATTAALLCFHQIQQIRVTPRSVSEVFKMAVDRLPPMREEGKGFQDAVVLLSVIDHLKTQTGKVGAFVSADSIYRDHRDAIVHFAEQDGVRLSLLDTIDDVSSALSQWVQKPELDEWEKDKERAGQALSSLAPLIERFIERNLVRTYDFEAAGRRWRYAIGSLMVARINNIETTPFAERREGERVRLTFDVLLGYGVSFGPYRPGMMDDMPSQVGALDDVAAGWLAEAMFGPEAGRDLPTPIVEVEAVADLRDGRYSDIQFISARLKFRKRTVSQSL